MNDLEQKHSTLITQFQSLNQKLDKFLNGTESETVTLGSKVVKTLSGIVDEILSASGQTPAGTSSTKPFDAYGFYPGTVPANAIVMKLMVGRASVVPANFYGSIANAEIAATNNSVFRVVVNGTQRGTITFSAGSSIGVWNSSSSLNLSVGDKVLIMSPSVKDTTLSDVSFTILTNRV